MKKASKRRILFAARMATMVGAACFAVSGISETLGQEKEKSWPVYIATEKVAETTYMPEVEETTQPSGRTYRKPHSKATYTASAPGEPPARRTGNLRMHWNGQVKSEGSTAGGGVQIIAELESQEKYAGYLENGTKKMAARPFVDKIKEKATPEIEKIYKEPYG